ncbi:ABC transporter ATP-binding protein [Paenibacillus sp. NPDC058071]|uniref:ABC transporter ATP-binding protein n=1 Tax=Paenibacillus sp. NPDC058071 TaxID=3346326 RepID=UPI0036D7C03F
MALLEVSELHTEFRTGRGTVKAINGIDFTVDEGEILAVVGESGSGKSVTALTVMGLLNGKHASITKGSIKFGNKELTRLSPKEYNRIRGEEMSMVFQNPLTALDPSFRIGSQLTEVIRLRRKGISGKQALEEARRLLEKVGITDPERVLRAYPHALSGGMRQRIVIAMAISGKPKLIIADEPTTALDATIQKQILELLRTINQEEQTSIMMITHDFGVVANISDKVAVMYAGKLIEYGRTQDVIANPLHPYTKGLIGSVPEGGKRQASEKTAARLQQIEGSPPDLLNLPEGCVFYERCPQALPRCSAEMPKSKTYSENRLAACFAVEEGAAL